MNERLVRDRGESDAQAQSAWRSGVVIVAWIALTSFGLTSDDRLALLVHCLVVVGMWSALAPGRRDGGPTFLARQHWTSVLAIPLVIAAVLAFWDGVRQGPLASCRLTYAEADGRSIELFAAPPQTLI
jgi:hypothetical protein